MLSKIFKSAFTRAGVFFFISLLGIGSAWAGYGDQELELTQPIGGDILPGGDLSAQNIKAGALFSKILPFAIKYAIGLAIAIAVIALIIGGYQYMTAYGVQEKHDNARKTITYALIGLILSITAYGIVAIVTSISLT